jgi:endogenous inhibitor of DNA gyrase (YacG/DUF329 family)
VGLATSDAVCVSCRRKPINPAWRPFCSERCKMADLGRWLTGDYRVPAEAVREPEDPGGDEDASKD